MFEEIMDALRERDEKIGALRQQIQDVVDLVRPSGALGGLGSVWYSLTSGSPVMEVQAALERARKQGLEDGRAEVLDDTSAMRDQSEVWSSWDPEGFTIFGEGDDPCGEDCEECADEDCDEDCDCWVTFGDLEVGDQFIDDWGDRMEKRSDTHASVPWVVDFEGAEAWYSPHDPVWFWEDE